VRNADRLLEDLVTDARARNAQQPVVTLPLNTDRDPLSLAARLSRRLAEHGRVMALTGAAAVTDYGGDLLVGGPEVAYASLSGMEGLLGDAFIDRQSPRLILVEPREEGMLHRVRPGAPPLVSPWQATIDLLSSANDREREVGAEVRRQIPSTEQRG
jgi:hypothetical protein